MKRLILIAAAALMLAVGWAGTASAGGRVYVYTSGGRSHYRSHRTVYYGTYYYPRRYYRHSDYGHRRYSRTRYHRGDYRRSRYGQSGHHGSGCGCGY